MVTIEVDEEVFLYFDAAMTAAIPSWRCAKIAVHVVGIMVIVVVIIIGCIATQAVAGAIGRA